jgi:hypothetical protein
MVYGALQVLVRLWFFHAFSFFRVTHPPLLFIVDCCGSLFV